MPSRFEKDSVPARMLSSIRKPRPQSVQQTSPTYYVGKYVSGSILSNINPPTCYFTYGPKYRHSRFARAAAAHTLHPAA